MKMVSSLEKCFYNDTIESKKEKNEFFMFKNERLSFQVMFRTDNPDAYIIRQCKVSVGGPLKKYAKVRVVGNVLNMLPCYAKNVGGEFIKNEPGAYPDVIRPFIYPKSVPLPHNQTHALWIDVELPEDFEAGVYDISVTMRPNDKNYTVKGKITVVDALLPKQKLIHTEWFYTDSIANYYHTKAFSEKHWKSIESFMKTAVRNGINMILTPLFTPELDTYIGGERLTTQLVDIELTGKDEYKFDFSKLERWIDLCIKCGVEYYEMPHMFTQWGAAAAPKIIVKVNGRNKKYFGWKTDAVGKEYEAFLSQFIPAVIEVFKNRGLDDKLFFHVSDEPSKKVLEQYQKCKNIIEKYVGGRPIIDALSHLEFYTMGIIKKPVPSTSSAINFYEAGVEGLWTYYCGDGSQGVSARSFAMPLRRTRILGVQLYKYDIEGFLHWGYNFYNSCDSYSKLDPYANPEGGFFGAAGDCFVVYPDTDGKALESLRLNALREAVDDMRALSLYEEKFGKEKALELIGDLDFKNYPKTDEYLINLRETIAKAFI